MCCRSLISDRDSVNWVHNSVSVSVRLGLITARLTAGRSWPLDLVTEDQWPAACWRSKSLTSVETPPPSLHLSVLHHPHLISSHPSSVNWPGNWSQALGHCVGNLQQWEEIKQSAFLLFLFFQHVFFFYFHTLANQLQSSLSSFSPAPCFASSVANECGTKAGAGLRSGSVSRPAQMVWICFDDDGPPLSSWQPAGGGWESA